MGRSSTCRSALGTTFDSRFWLSVDPCGLICITLSVSAHTFALYVIPTHLISHSLVGMILFSALYVPVASLALVSLFMAWTTNPGAVPLGARPLDIPSESQLENVITAGVVKGKKNGFTAGVAKASGEDSLSKEEVDSQVRPLQRQLSSSSQRAVRRGIRRCRKCNDNFKPARAHHDSVTGRCIVKMDHYCPWVCNAVGALNHKFFFLFILYTFLTSISSLVLIITRFTRCGSTVEKSESNDSGDTAPGSTDGDAEGDFNATGKEDEDLDPSLRHLRSVVPNSDDYEFKYPGCENLFGAEVLILTIITVMFLFFTCCMLLEQIETIESNTGKIARMKINAGQGGSELSRVTSDFNEMFGGNSPNVALHWFLPTPVKFPDGMRDIVLGYKYDPVWAGEVYREDEAAEEGNLGISGGGGGDTGGEEGLGSPDRPPLPNPKDDGTAELGSPDEDGGSSTRRSVKSAESRVKKRTTQRESRDSVSLGSLGSIHRLS